MGLRFLTAESIAQLFGFRGQGPVPAMPNRLDDQVLVRTYPGSGARNREVGVSRRAFLVGCALVGLLPKWEPPIAVGFADETALARGHSLRDRRDATRSARRERVPIVSSRRQIADCRRAGGC